MADNSDQSDSEVDFTMNQNEDVREYAHHGEGHALLHRRGPRPNIRPDTYSGDEDWDQYIAYFEDCAELAQWTNKEKLLYLATSLKQQARVHYSSLPVLDKRSYKLLTDRLEQRFGSKRQQNRWLSKMQNRTRGKSEAIAAFGDEIRLLAQKAYSTLDQEAQEMLALQHFNKNVSAEMRCRLMDRNCKTISEAVEVVERYEEVLGRAGLGTNMTQIRGVTNASTTVRQRDSASTPSNVDDLSGAIRRIEQRLEKLESFHKTRSPGRSCYRCGNVDHFIRECPLKESVSRRGMQSGNFKPSHQ